MLPKDLDDLCVERRASLSTAHQRACDRFAAALGQHRQAGLLSAQQAWLVMDHVVRLGEREYNPANTGNLEDLFTYTLTDTRDPVRAFAQVLADSIKIVPMPPEATLWPAIKNLGTGALHRTVGELPLGAPQQMLVAHTNVAYTDRDMVASAEAFLLASNSSDPPERGLAKMAAQSQHMPSSSFVLAAASGLAFDIESMFVAADYPEHEVEAALQFFTAASAFDSKWLAMFMHPGPRDDPAYRAWLDGYHRARRGLPADSIYQLFTDTLTNFQPGTMSSGKWIDAAVQFAGIKDVTEAPQALANVVNQYLAEFIDLHQLPTERFVSTNEAVLAGFGVVHQDGGFVASDWPPPHQGELEAQFEAAWHRKMAHGVLQTSPLFAQLGPELSTRLLDCFERRVYHAGEMLQHRGNAAVAFFVVVEGELEARESAEGGGEVSTVLGPGEVLGEIGLLCDDPAQVSAAAKQDSVVLVLPRGRFGRLSQRHMEIHNYLVELDVDRLRRFGSESR